MKVFVTRELHPFTAGGIGRVIANILVTEDRSERMGVLYIGDEIDESAFRQIYPDVMFLAWPRHRYRTREMDGQWYPPFAAYRDQLLHWESVHISQGLDEFARKFGSPDYVEFTDWGGAAFAATQRKVLGVGLDSTVLAVRLHSTDSILADFELRPQGVAGLTLYDLERKALADCDVLVGQVAPVAEAFRLFYGFEKEDWESRLRLHAPPVLLDAAPLAESSTGFGIESPLLFTSKLQDIKRPAVFVQGCMQFMRETPEYRGSVIFLAHSFDPVYQRYIESLVPEDLESRVVFMPGVKGAAREQMISRGICVFPSPWESFCLAAYEASLSGAMCVLNSENPAFGNGTPWVAGVNCEKFDGSAPGLAESLNRMFTEPGKTLGPVQIPCDSVPWVAGLPEAPAQKEYPRIDVVVINRDGGSGLLGTLNSVLSAGGAVQGIIIIDQGSTDPRDAVILKQLSEDESIRVKFLGRDAGDAASLNAGLQAVESDLVAFLRAGDRFIDGFVDTAARAFGTHLDLDVIIPQQVECRDVDVPPGDLASLSLLESHPERYTVFLGEARASGLYVNDFSRGGFLMRSHVAKRYGFDPMTTGAEVWEFLMRVCLDGCRFAVLPAIGVATASSPRLQSHGNAREASRRFHGKQARVGRVTLPAYVFMNSLPATNVMSERSADAEVRLRELLDAESVRYTLAVAHFLKRRAPWILEMGKRVARRAARLRH